MSEWAGRPPGVKLKLKPLRPGGLPRVAGLLALLLALPMASNLGRAASPPALPPSHAPAQPSAQGPATAPALQAVSAPATASARQPAAALPLPQPARLDYALRGTLRGLPYTAEGQITWQHDGRRYEAHMRIHGLLLRERRMRSVGEIGPHGLSPRRYLDQSRRERSAQFEPEHGRIVFSSNAPQAAWQPGAQDRLSLFFQLAGLLAAEPARSRPGAQLQLLTAGTGEASAWTFTVVGRPVLALPSGPQATVALRREPREPQDQTVELWLAPGLDHLPVRIRITQPNGDVLDQQLAAVQPL